MRSTRHRLAGATVVIALALACACAASARAADAQSPTATGPVPAKKVDLPPVKVGFVVAAALVQYPLMIGLPIVLGLRLRRRLSVPLWVWFVGMASFVGSQVVHLPLNALLDRPLAGAPLGVVAVTLGLSAGLCEELARYLAMRLLLRRQQAGWATAMLLGAGHGGVEAIIFGVLAALGMVSMLAVPLMGERAALPEVQAAVWSYWVNPWYLPVYAGVERVGAMMSHLGMSVLVMRAVTRKNLLWLAAAVGAHALMDGLLLPLKAARVDDLWLEVVVLVIGAALLSVALWMREPAPKAAGEPA
jgi:uncharacterized membrane protein YhfC